MPSRALAGACAATVLAATASASAVPAAASTACGTHSYTPTAGARFNNPRGPHATQYAVLDPIINSICSAPKGATVRVAVYSMTVTRFADALIDAHKRGVIVQVLMDSHAVNDLWRRLVAGLSSPKTKSFARTCSGGCLSGYRGSALHSKLYMMSTAGSAKGVVTLSSANPTRTQAEIADNNSYTIIGNTTVYNAYRYDFQAMAAAAASASKRQPNYYRSTTITGYKAYFFPRSGTGNGKDTVYGILGNTTCSTTASKTATVRVAMFQWTAGRKNIADKLVSMGRAGCRIQIVLTAGAVDKTIRTTLAGKKNVSVTDSSADANGDGTADHYTHDKYVLISGTYAGYKNSHVVFTGSPNFTINGLHHNDEIMIRLTPAGNYSAYAADFARQRAAVTAKTLSAPRAVLPPLRIPAYQLADS